LTRRLGGSAEDVILSEAKDLLTRVRKQAGQIPRCARNDNAHDPRRSTLDA